MTATAVEDEIGASAAPETGDAADARDAVQSGEATGESTNNPFQYPEKTALNNVGGSKPKGRGIGRKQGIIGGVIGGVLLTGMFSISSFKIPGVFDMVLGGTMGRVQSYVEKRAAKVLIAGVLGKIGVVPKNVVKGGSPMSMLIKTVIATKYDERLAAKGLEIVKGADGKAMVYLRNADSASGKKLLAKALGSEDEVLKAINGTPLSKDILRSIMKEDVGIWRYILRGNLAKWMRKYYGVPRFGKNDPNEKDPDKAAAKTAAEEIEEAVDRQGKAIEDLMNIEAESSGKSEDRPNSQAAEAAKEAPTSEMKKSLSDTLDGLKGKSADAITKAIIKGSEKLGLKLTEEVVKKAGSKAIPVYGWVVLASNVYVLQHWLISSTADGSAARSLGAIRGMLMGVVFSKWAGLSSQVKLGTLSASLMSYHTPFLDGVEGSSSFNCINTDWQSGCDKKGEPVANRVDEQSPSWMPALERDSAILKLYNADPLYYLAKGIVFVDNKLWGAIADLLLKGGELAMSAAEKLVPGFVEQVSSLISSTGSYLLKFAGLDINLLAANAPLFNILGASSTFTNNRWLESKGGGKVTLAEARQQTARALAEENDYVRSKGLLYALFSPESSKSVTSQLAVRTSGSGGIINIANNLIASTARVLRGAPSTLAAALSPSAKAADKATTSPEEVYGVTPIGFSDAQIASPVSEELSTGEACPDNEFNNFSGARKPTNSLCTLDTDTATAIRCSLDTELGESAECNPDIGESAQAAAPQSGTFVWPIAKEDWPGDVHDCDFRYTFEGGTVHTGIDISVANVPLFAVTSGTIHRPDDDYGMVDIQYKDANGKTMYVNYQHLSSITVKEGDTVRAGDRIGTSGSVGAEGAHLHFSLWDVPLLSGHMSPTESEGEAVLSHMWHPLSVLPDDGRGVTTCGEPPYRVPGGN